MTDLFPQPFQFRFLNLLNFPLQKLYLQMENKKHCKGGERAKLNFLKLTYSIVNFCILA